MNHSGEIYCTLKTAVRARYKTLEGRIRSLGHRLCMPAIQDILMHSLCA